MRVSKQQPGLSEAGAFISFFFASSWCHYQKSSNVESLAVPTAAQFCWGRWCRKGKGICSDRQMVMVSRTSLGLRANDRLGDLHVQPRVLVQLTVNRLLCVSALLRCYNKSDRRLRGLQEEGGNCWLQASSEIFTVVFTLLFRVFFSR